MTRDDEVGNDQPTFSSGALADSPQLEEEIASAAWGWDDPISDAELNAMAAEAAQLPLPFPVLSSVVMPDQKWGGERAVAS